MTLAACAKEVKFYTWPNINFFGVYETPADCMKVKSISWCCEGKQILVVKSKGPPIIIDVPSTPEQYIEPYDCLNVNFVNVGTYSNTSANIGVFGFEDGEVLLYNIKKKQRLITGPKQLPSAIQNLEFSSDDQSIAAGCSNGQIILLDSKLKPCASFMVPNSPSLSTLAFCQCNPNLLGAASKEGVLSLWETETADNVFFNKTHSGRIPDIAFSENTISSIGNDGKFISFDLRSRKLSACCELDCPLTSLAYVPGTYELAISTISGQLRSYDVRNMYSPVRTFVANINGGFKKIAFAKTVVDSGASSTYGSKNITKAYEDDFSASGDFSILTDSSHKRCGPYQKPRKYPTAEEGMATSAEVIASPREKNLLELEAFGKLLEDKLKSTAKDYEDRLQQHFYAMRINTSKHFIGLEDKISKSWSDFVEYLRLSGEAIRVQSLTVKGTDYDSHDNTSQM